MASIVDICNLALAMVGDKRISTFPDTSTVEGEKCVLFYEQDRDEVLSQAGVKFNCAKARMGPLAAVSNQPEFGWDYAYQVPVNCARIDNLVDEYDVPLTASWKREGVYILTNEEEVYINYIKKEVDEATFSPQIIRAIATKLASDICFPLTGDRQLAESLLQKFEVVENMKAITANQDDGNDEDEAGEFTWVSEGRISES